MNSSSVENLFTVSKQLFPHFPHLLNDAVISNLSIPSLGNKVDFSPSIYLSFAIRAQPNAPISPEISGLTASLPDISSKLLSTASL